MKKTVFILFFLVNNFIVFGQTTDTINNVASDDTSEFSYFYNAQEVTKFLSFKPIIGIGKGIFTYLGDVRDVYYSNPLVGLPATNLNVSKGISEAFSLNFFVTYGNITGNQHSLTQNYNFKTNVVVGAAYITYNFYHLLKKEGQLISFNEQRRLIPLISVGIESFNFNSKTDLKDANGNYYHYWSDGTIRNVEETPDNEYNSIILQRDYNYETDLRELNNDGLGKYNLTSLSLPIDIGVQLNISKRITMKLGTSYHIAFSDLVDDISKAGTSNNRKGNSAGDNFLYSYITFNFDVFSADKEIIDTTLFKDFMFESIDIADEDNDSILDWDDKCPGTPAGVKVDAKGCPLDDDDDGIPNYRDKEINSPNAFTVKLNGVTYTDEELLAFSTPPEAIDQSEIYDYYPSLRGYGEFRKRFNGEIPDKFLSIDTNKDGYISLDEITDALDKFFDFKLDMTMEDIIELTNFFFEQ